MRITRAAKVAVFPLMALVLVVFIACQGAAGVTGDQGPRGTPGTSGTPGTPGTPGTDAFQARSRVAAVLLNPDQLVDEEGRAVDADGATPAEGKTVAFPIDLGDYFIGGSGDHEYEIVEWTFDDSITDAGVLATLRDEVIGAEIDGDLLKVTLTMPQDPDGGWEGSKVGGSDHLYTFGLKAQVRGTDNGVEDDGFVTVRLNRAPRHGADADDDGVLDASRLASHPTRTASLMLGVQEIKHRNAADDADEARPAVAGFHTACELINHCVLDVFTDDDEMTLRVVSMTRDDVEDNGKVNWELDDGAIRLIGMASTFYDPDPGGAPGTYKPVTVTLEATDSRGLSTQISVIVDVSSLPTLSQNAVTVPRSWETEVGEAAVISTLPRGLFSPAKEDGLIISVESSSLLIAAPEFDPSISIPPGAPPGGLKVTGVNRGTATVTLKARGTELSFWQEVTMEFTVTVK